jgi:hypothetical protein
MITEIPITLSFSGASSDGAVIDFYDVSQALLGFQRSLALTTHLALNGEIITQAPSLKGAKIFVSPPEYGSWKVNAYIVMGLTGLYQLGTAPKDTPIGHVVYSLYDYMISETLGGHVDYDKTLGEIYEKAKRNKLPLKEITESQADALVEKCSAAVREMHRPIAITGTAKSAGVGVRIGQNTFPIHTALNFSSYEYMLETRQSLESERVIGRISSYNSNTYKGRIYVGEIGRPVNFEINPKARSESAIEAITTSLHLNANKLGNHVGSLVAMTAFRRESKGGHLKSYLVMHIERYVA